MKSSVDLGMQFTELARQREADRLGMVIFLGTEVMLFGGLFAAIFALRVLHPQDYLAAAGQLHLWLGALNTCILLTSSLAVAIAVEAARHERGRLAVAGLLAAALLGIVFLGIKGFEYLSEYREGLMPLAGVAHHFEAPPQQLFMNLYFAATGLHALHLLIGIATVSVVAALAARDVASPETIENAGLYWHLVDIVWVFLYPSLYLMRG